jgi:hypothetical protein
LWYAGPGYWLSDALIALDEAATIFAVPDTVAETAVLALDEAAAVAVVFVGAGATTAGIAEAADPVTALDAPAFGLDLR